MWLLRWRWRRRRRKARDARRQCGSGRVQLRRGSFVGEVWRRKQRLRNLSRELAVTLVFNEAQILVVLVAVADRLRTNSSGTEHPRGRGRASAHLESYGRDWDAVRSNSRRQDRAWLSTMAERLYQYATVGGNRVVRWLGTTVAGLTASCRLSQPASQDKTGNRLRRHRMTKVLRRSTDPASENWSLSQSRARQRRCSCSTATALQQ